MNNAYLPADTRFARSVRPATTAALISGAMFVIAGFFAPATFFRAYLFAWLFCLSASLGGTSIVMLHHLTGGRWGWPVRRLGEAAAATMPMVAVAFVPLIVGARRLFPWADPIAISSSVALQQRAVLFQPSVVFIRAIIFLLLWVGAIALLRRWSLAHDRTGDSKWLARLARLSALGLVFYFITMSLASVDWIASREVDWYSSTIGLVTIVGQAVTGLCVLIVALSWSRGPGAPDVAVPVVHDLANLLQTVVVLWAYVSFMQYLVIWSGNTQEDIVWFHHRTTGSWNLVGIGLIVGHFAVPFVLLLFQQVKRNVTALTCVAGGILIMRAVDGLWTIAPSNAADASGSATLLDPLALVALGGLWWTWFVHQCARHPLLPRAMLAVDDTEFEGSHVTDVVIH